MTPDPPMAPSADDPVVEHLPLHPESFRILLALRGKALHGYAVVKELEKDPDRPGRVLPANLYRRIRTLRDDGLIEESDREPGPDEDPRRRYFRLTGTGRAVARAEAARLQQLLAEASELLPG